MGANVPGQVSADGAYYWDGAQWVTTLSKDGAHRWNGSAWVPVASTAPQPAPMPPPPTPTGLTPTPTPLARPATSGLAFQFGGAALWSIGFGLAAILAPRFTSIYFPVLPIFGFLNAYRALRVGRTAGGAIGIVLNILGGIASLIASGLILR
jgi:hypothetical protein